MHIDWNVPIAMDDGAVLRADVFRPIEAGAYPTLMSYGPYAKWLPMQIGYAEQWRRMSTDHPDIPAGSTNKYQTWEVADPEKWVPHGYAIVRVDSRGAGCSPGYMEVWSPREARDLRDCIEWAAAQEWSNGKVGLSGISYYAMNQWHVARLNPPHLAAMVAWEGSADFYRELARHGGILCEFALNWHERQVKTVQYGVGDRAPTNPMTGQSAAGPVTLSDEELAANRSDFPGELRRRTLDEQWYRERSAHWEAITVPFLSAANWGGQGLHLRGNIEAFTQAASEHKWLEVHGLEHWTHYLTDYGVSLQRRFFDRYLKGEENGWGEESRVLLNIRRPGSCFELRREHEWPLARTEWRRYYLDAQTCRLAGEVSEQAGTVEYEPLGDGAMFLTAPAAEEWEITGPLAAKLYVSSETVDADLFLVVGLFDPGEAEVTFMGCVDPHTPVAQGWLRASHRRLDESLSTFYRPYHTHDRVEPLVPGEVYELDVEIWPTCVVVPPGYRIGLNVRGCDYVYSGEPDVLETFAHAMTGCGPFVHDDPEDRPREVFGGKVTVHTGPKHGSYLLLPVIP
jgi:predicted acyl esterase